MEKPIRPKRRKMNGPYNQAPHRDPGSMGTGEVRRGGGGGRSIGYKNTPVNGNTLSHGNSTLNTIFGAPRPGQGKFVRRAKAKERARQK